MTRHSPSVFFGMTKRGEITLGHLWQCWNSPVARPSFTKSVTTLCMAGSSGLARIVRGGGGLPLNINGAPVVSTFQTRALMGAERVIHFFLLLLKEPGIGSLRAFAARNFSFSKLGVLRLLALLLFLLRVWRWCPDLACSCWLSVAWQDGGRPSVVPSGGPIEIRHISPWAQRRRRLWHSCGGGGWSGCGGGCLSSGRPCHDRWLGCKQACQRRCGHHCCCSCWRLLSPFFRFA